MQMLAKCWMLKIGCGGCLHYSDSHKDVLLKVIERKINCIVENL